jgi:xanthosine utilization system XapX-like protein
MHVPKKCFNYYLFSGVFCILAILLSILMTSLMLKIIPSPPLINKIHFAFGLMFGIVVGLTLIAVALYRYGKNCIEVAIYKRKHGENLKNQNELLNQKNNLKNMSEDEIKLKRKENEDYSSVTTATSNLINNVDKEQENSSN